MSKIVSYFKNTWNESKKITWPTKKQTLNYSVLVICLSIGFALYFVALDYVFNLGLENLISR
jgi:preprotein translocase subunit SecE